MKESEPQKNITKSLIKVGSVVSGAGVLITAESIITQHGELGPVGLIVGATGATLLLTAVRRKA